MTHPLPSVAIVDVGVSNVGSLANMCAKLGRPAVITRDPDLVSNVEYVLLPGVGAFDGAMARLEQADLIGTIRGRAEAGRRLLGICLGMQLLFEGSDEGVRAGLGIVPGWVRRLAIETAEGRVRIPHMGWNTVMLTRSSPVLQHVDATSRFYFVHSYAPVPSADGDILAYTSHGAPFVSMVERSNVCGVQFHPEKSHRHGAALLRSFFEN